MLKIILVSAFLLNIDTYGYANNLSDYFGKWNTFHRRMDIGTAKSEILINNNELIFESEVNISIPMFDRHSISHKMESRITNHENIDASTIEVTTLLQKAYIQINSTVEARERSYRNYCGISNWPVGTYVDVTNRTCMESEDDPPEEWSVYTAGKVAKVRFKLDTKNRLYSDSFEVESLNINSSMEPVPFKTPFYKL